MYYFFYTFYKITKIKIKIFECPKSIKIINKNNTSSIRLLVDDSFVPSSKQPSVIYCRLTDLNCHFQLKQCIFSPRINYSLSGVLNNSSLEGQILVHLAALRRQDNRIMLTISLVPLLILSQTACWHSCVKSNVSNVLVTTW